MRHLLFPLALLALAACSRDSQPQRNRGLPQTPAVEVTAVDQFGPVSGAVAGIAMWTHPTLPFNGLVIAAGDAGLVAYNIEDGAEVARADTQGGVDGVSLAYLGRGAEARGILAVRTPSAKPTERAFAFYEIDNMSRALNRISSLSISTKNSETGFCLGRTKDGEGLTLHQTHADGWQSTALTFRGDGTLSGRETGAGEFRDGFTRCVVDPLDGAVFVVNAAGDIFKIEDGAVGISPHAATGVSDSAGISLTLNGLADGTPEDQCCGQIALLDGANAVVHLFDREDGHVLGAVRMVASFDVEAVASASALGIGYGNFGAVYRDGLVALATEDRDSAIRLAPFNGVMDALAQPLGETANPRDLAPQEEEGFVIDVEVVKP